MKRKFILFSILLLSLVVFYGCSQNIARFSVATTGNLPMTNVKKGKTVEGRDCIHSIFGIDIGNENNRVSGAVSDALDKAADEGQPSDALVNVDIKHSSWSILIYGRDCIYATGQPIAIGHHNTSSQNQQSPGDSINVNISR